MSNKFYSQTTKMKFISRRFCTAIGEQFSRDKTCHPHIFNSILYRNLQELSSYLQKNVIYNKNGLILLNKPYGLKKQTTKEKEFWQRKIDVARSPSVEQTDHLNFYDVIPYLSKELNVPDLRLLKMPERYISGVSILCNSETWEKKIAKNFFYTNTPLSTYLAICIGIPLKLADDIKLGLTLSEKNKNKKATFVTSYSKRSAIMKKVIPVVMNHQTLSVNEILNVSLVQIRNNRNKWNALRAYCAQKLLSPILGDSIYGSCVKVLFKHAVPIDPFNPIASLPPKIPLNILSQLELKSNQARIIPTHLHLAQINFSKLDGKNGTFIARPPDHFLWTCEKLNLTVPDFYLRNYYTNLEGLLVEKCERQVERNCDSKNSMDNFSY